MKKLKKIESKSTSIKSDFIEEKAIQWASDLIVSMVLGMSNFWGMYLLNSKTIHEAHLYKNFMKINFGKDYKIGNMVKKLPNLWLMGIFRFDVLWISFFWLILWINENYLHFRSGVILAGRFGYGKFDAVNIIWFIIWICLYIVFKRYLAIRSQIFKNLMSETNEILRDRLNKKK